MCVISENEASTDVSYLCGTAKHPTWWTDKHSLPDKDSLMIIVLNFNGIQSVAY